MPNKRKRIKTNELAIRRALLYAPLPPRAERRDRAIYWTQQRALAALRTLDRQPSHEAWVPTPKGMPSVGTLKRLFGTWNAAMEAAGWKPRPSNAFNRDDELTAEWQLRVDNGATLVELAAEIGMTPQALGRRLRDYRAKHPEWNHRVPQPGNRNPLRRAA